MTSYFRYFHYLVVLVHRKCPPPLVEHNITQVLDFKDHSSSPDEASLQGLVRPRKRTGQGRDETQKEEGDRVEYKQSFSQAATAKRVLSTCSLWRSEKNTSAGENISCWTNYDQISGPRFERLKYLHYFFTLSTSADRTDKIPGQLVNRLITIQWMKKRYKVLKHNLFVTHPGFFAKGDNCKLHTC